MKLRFRQLQVFHAIIELGTVTGAASQLGISQPSLIARFAKDRPDMKISFQSQYSGKVQEWVNAGLFEIGICELP